VKSSDAREDGTGVAVLAITTERCPQVLNRLLGLVAQQDRAVEWLRVDSSARSYRVSLAIAGIDRQRAEVIGRKMQALIRVRTVKLRLRAARPG
jgi:hypothetical protein